MVYQKGPCLAHIRVGCHLLNMGDAGMGFLYPYNHREAVTLDSWVWVRQNGADYLL